MKRRGRWRERWASIAGLLGHNRMGLVGLAMLGLAIGVAVFAPRIAPYDPHTTARVTIEDIYAKPSAAHLLGTDDGGKDVFSAFVYGARVSLVVGFTASLISMLIGGSVGLIAGFYGGRLGNVLMRLTDIFLVIPDLPL
ncbi:MAG: ABC transporter permease, partial [Chloroflexi bacterium]|nr:ABC transporter permease [Chloroflexota bacterium]